ncbi:flagellar basal body L-ring protein FlgH [Sporomusa malonica]|uniref:Flagellar L-ring protein n=1 Tax=Sporomusa malonica TaxID=112901 RepID=A0A1W1YRV0_9FIRM|nr:flagellar basal body L-ring protein FlgH [Sporomusa malonica]SMC38448.1 flagellar L-ring protein precursor FlgH [Sporomusa malonica]
MRKLVGFLLVLTVIMVSIPTAQAESLWVDAVPSANLFTDHRAHAVGDVITIVISESSSASRSGSSANSKSASANLDAGVGIFSFLAAASAATSDDFQSKGSIANTNKVTGRVTVKVTELKPNGQMVISGTQSIKQNGEEQKITITGIVRPADVTADNTVLSSNVADAQLRIDGKGPLTRKQRQGILTQIFNFVF